MTTSTTIFQDVGLPFMVMILSITRFLSTPPLFFLSSSQNTENLIKLHFAFRYCSFIPSFAELKLPCLIFQISKDSEIPTLKVWMQSPKTDEFRLSSFYSRTQRSNNFSTLSKTLQKLVRAENWKSFRLPGFLGHQIALNRSTGIPEYRPLIW